MSEPKKGRASYAGVWTLAAIVAFLLAVGLTNMADPTWTLIRHHHSQHHAV